MNFNELVSMRESCRNFNGSPVGQDLLAQIIDTVRLAPSACNSQPWHFTVVVSDEYKAKVADAVSRMGVNRFAVNVSAFIVINEEHASLSARIGGFVKSQEYAQFDIGIAAAHIVLAARDLGVSSCIMGWFDEPKLRSACGIDDSKRVRLVIALGYTDDDQPRPKKRRPVSEISNIL